VLSGVLDYEVTSAVVLGGSVGSATTQQLLLVGLLVVGVGRLSLDGPVVRTTYLPMLGAVALLFALAVDGRLSRVDGLLLVAAYLVVAVYGYRRRERRPVPVEADVDVRRRAAVAVVALALVLVSASLLLGTVELVVAALPFGGSFVGVVTLGVAAALPELSTVLASIRRQTPGVALGTLLGSNLVNLLLGVGGGALLSTYAVPPVVVGWDLPYKFLAGAGLLACARRRDGALLRRDGTTLLGLYFAFVVGRLLLFPGQ
jgi:cation:H+ antiporter